MTEIPAPTETLPEWGVDRVDPERMKLLALLLADPNPLHYDLAAARRAGFPERINQGPASIAMLINMLRAAFPSGRLTTISVVLRGTVLAGQRVRAGGHVVERRSGPGGEVVTCDVHLDVVPGGTVLTGRAEIALDGPPAGATFATEGSDR